MVAQHIGNIKTLVRNVYSQAYFCHSALPKKKSPIEYWSKERINGLVEEFYVHD